MCGYHDLSDFLRVVSIQVELKSHHFPIVCFQLALGNPVTHIRDLKDKNQKCS